MHSNNHPESKISISYRERRWILYLLDVLAINGGLLLSVHLREDYQLSWDLILQNPDWFIYLTFLWFLWGYFFQVYDIERASQWKTAFISSLSSALVTVFIYNFTPYLPPTLPPSRQPLAYSLALPILLLLCGRLIYISIFSQPRFRRRLLILGAGWAGRTVYQALLEHAQTYYEVVGFVDDDPQKQGSSVSISYLAPESQLEGQASAPVLGGSEQVIDLAVQHQVSTVVIAISSLVEGRLYQVLTDCLQLEIEIVPMPLLYEQLTGKVPVEHIGDHWSIAMPIEQPGTRLAWHAVKRLFDLFWSTIGLAFLAVLFPFLALAIKLDSQGPIFYTQKRMGRNGKVFKVYKFRSMVENAETDQAVWAQKDDPRVTKVGRILRKTHIDEFPQFWNILKGEMSVVGPRPERPEFIQELAEEIPFYRVRLAVKPGMAGWGLIHQGYGASKKDALEKLQYDLFYIKHQSFWLDLQILFRTLISSLSFRGR